MDHCLEAVPDQSGNTLNYVSMAESCTMDQKVGDMTKVLQELQERAHFVIKKLRPTHVADDTESVRCILMIPVKFVEQHGDKFFQIVKLRSRVCVEPIKVRLFIYDYRPRRAPEVMLGTGWKDFAARNELSIGVSLIFELIGVSEFEVHIFRGGKSTSSANPSKTEASVREDCLSSWGSKKRRIGGGSVKPESSVSVEMKHHDSENSSHVENRLINMEIRLINVENRLINVENRLINEENRLINVENTLIKTENSWRVKEEERQPSFVQRLEVHNVQDAAGNSCGACFEIPVGFVKKLQIKRLWLDRDTHVKLQGIQENSPVRAVACAYKSNQLDREEFDSTARTMSGLSLGWGDFVRENGLRAGQVLVFTIVAASFFTVRELR